MRLNLAAPSSSLPTVSLRYGEELYSGPVKSYPLGQRAKTDDNRIFYFAQNDSGEMIPKGLLVAGPVKGQIIVMAVENGKLVPKERQDGLKYGITITDVGPNDYFWAQAWGNSSVKRSKTVYGCNIPEQMMAAFVESPIGYVEEWETDGMSSAYLTVSP